LDEGDGALKRRPVWGAQGLPEIRRFEGKHYSSRKDAFKDMAAHWADTYEGKRRVTTGPTPPNVASEMAQAKARIWLCRIRFKGVAVHWANTYKGQRRVTPGVRPSCENLTRSLPPPWQTGKGCHFWCRRQMRAGNERVVCMLLGSWSALDGWAGRLVA